MDAESSSEEGSVSVSVSFCDGDFFKTYGLKHIRVAGRGLTSVVILSKPCDGSDLQAVKMLSKEARFGGKVNRNYFEKEVKMLKSVRHKHVMEIITACESPDMFVISMPFYEKGNLLSHLSTMTTQLIDKYLLQLTSAVGYLHAHQIAHRDIKPDNVLISDEGNVILSDFGLSCAVTSDKMRLTHKVGTKAYAAPEMLKGRLNQEISYYKCDMYSLGIVLWCMVVGEEATLDQTDHLEILPRDESYQGSYRHLIENLLHNEPEERWDSNQLVSTLWLTWPSKGHDLTQYFESNEASEAPTIKEGEVIDRSVETYGNSSSTQSPTCQTTAIEASSHSTTEHITDTKTSETSSHFAEELHDTTDSELPSNQQPIETSTTHIETSTPISVTNHTVNSSTNQSLINTTKTLSYPEKDVIAHSYTTQFAETNIHPSRHGHQYSPYSFHVTNHPPVFVGIPVGQSCNRLNFEVNPHPTQYSSQEHTRSP